MSPGLSDAITDEEFIAVQDAFKYMMHFLRGRIPYSLGMGVVLHRYQQKVKKRLY
jgi:hypothetical protein